MWAVRIELLGVEEARGKQVEKHWIDVLSLQESFRLHPVLNKTWERQKKRILNNKYTENSFQHTSR